MGKRTRSQRKEASPRYRGKPQIPGSNTMPGAKDNMRLQNWFTVLYTLLL